MTVFNPSFHRIIGGPNTWGLIIDSLARRGKRSVVFKLEGDQSQCANIMRLGSECIVSGSPFCPNEELQYDQMADMLGEDFDWENAWFFEGHSPNMRSIPVWGIYSTHSRQGVLAACYIGA